jgi:hypothetical protein
MNRGKRESLGYRKFIPRHLRPVETRHQRRKRYKHSGTTSEDLPNERKNVTLWIVGAASFTVSVKGAGFSP